MSHYEKSITRSLLRLFVIITVGCGGDEGLPCRSDSDCIGGQRCEGYQRGSDRSDTRLPGPTSDGRLPGPSEPSPSPNPQPTPSFAGAAGGETLGLCAAPVTSSDKREATDTTDGGDGRGICKGSARSCRHFAALWSCRNQRGCWWSFASESCGGRAKSCYDFSDDQKKCKAHSGCGWQSR